MSTIIQPQRKVTPPPPDEPWFYGWRDVAHKLPDGTVKFEQIPLTLEDTLHPQQGDFIVESDLHDILCGYLATIFRWQTAADPGAVILSDTGVYWDDPDLPYTHHCPDVAAIFGVKNRKREYPSFSVGKEGVRPRLIVELVSPNNRDNDVETKVRHYHEVEIPMYVIADREEYGGSWKLIGYLWRPDEYVRIQSDARGRLWLDCVGMWLGTEGMRLICYDRHGVEIGDYAEIARQLAEERRRTSEARHLAEAEKQRAEAARQQAEVEKQHADVARQQAEVEKRRADAAEAKVKEIQAELARLRGQ